MTLERIGPYRIVRLLGKGGMGAVYEGLHEAIERRVAIKVLHAELGRRQDLATRFFNGMHGENPRRQSSILPTWGTAEEPNPDPGETQRF